MEPAQARRVEARLAGTHGLHPRADALEPGEDALPCVGDADRIGRDEMQRRAAGEGLAHPHAGMDAEGLGGRGDLPHVLLATGLRRECRRVPEQGPATAGGDRELEAWKQDADDHDRTHVRIVGGWMEGPRDALRESPAQPSRGAAIWARRTAISSTESSTTASRHSTMSASRSAMKARFSPSPTSWAS